MHRVGQGVGFTVFTAVNEESMNTVRILLVIIVALVVVIYYPRGVWRELKRVWARRDWILRISVVGVSIYLLYGLFRMYQQGMLDAWW